ncbi:MAG: HNH endonuclease [Thermoplasmata archaeon]
MPIEPPGDEPTWKKEILAIIRGQWNPNQVFSLEDLYAISGPLAKRHASNRNVEEKIRQILQQLRDDGEITFVDFDGHYSSSKLKLDPGDGILRVPTQDLRSQLIRIRDMLGEVVRSSELQRQIRGFGSQKGIYKPSGSRYALWVRQTLKSPYPDRDLRYRPDGSWTYRYSPEGRAGLIDLNLDANKSLLRCMEDHVPVGVFRQISGGGGLATYEILGLAIVESFDGEHFVLHGESIEPEKTPAFANMSPKFLPFEFSTGRHDLVSRIVRDHRFGVAVRRIYHERCSLCNIGFRVGGQSTALDAAHIIPVNEKGVMGDLRNGILLCKNHHALFDDYAWTMDSDLSVRLAPDKGLRESALGNHIVSLEGKRLPNLPTEEENRPAAEAVRWRLDRFDRAWR